MSRRKRGDLKIGIRHLQHHRRGLENVPLTVLAEFFVGQDDIYIASGPCQLGKVDAINDDIRFVIVGRNKDLFTLCVPPRRPAKTLSSR